MNPLKNNRIQGILLCALGGLFFLMTGISFTIQLAVLVVAVALVNQGLIKLQLPSLSMLLNMIMARFYSYFNK